MCNIEIDKDKDIKVKDDRVDPKEVTFNTKNHINFMHSSFAYYSINPKT